MLFACPVAKTRRSHHGSRCLPAALFALLFLLVGCRAPNQTPPDLIQIDGSSTVFPIAEAMAEEFQIARQGRVRMSVGISGSGGGFKRFCRGELDIATASRPIEAMELSQCHASGVEFIELPLAFDAITLVVNPANTWLHSIDLATLRKIWQPQSQGQITRWSQLDPGFPDAPLNLYGAGSESGTFDYFTAVVNGQERASRGDYTASEDDNLLVRGVANDHYALGYFGLAYFQENQDQLRPLAVVNQRGQAVLPSPLSVQAGEYQPLSRPVFLYVRVKALERAAVSDFLEFVFSLKNRAEIIPWVGYVPLPDDVYQQVLYLLRQRVPGSRFRDAQGQVLDLEQALASVPVLPDT